MLLKINLLDASILLPTFFHNLFLLYVKFSGINMRLITLFVEIRIATLGMKNKVLIIDYFRTGPQSSLLIHQPITNIVFIFFFFFFRQYNFIHK